MPEILTQDGGRRHLEFFKIGILAASHPCVVIIYICVPDLMRLSSSTPET